MRDVHDAMGAAGAEPAADVVDALAEPDAMAADLDRIRADRRRRGVRRIGVAAIGIAALAATGWLTSLEPDGPPDNVAEGVVREVPPMLVNGFMDACYSQAAPTGEPPAPYVPWADPGVWIANDSVRDSGIEVEATLLTSAIISNDDLTVLEPPATMAATSVGTDGSDVLPQVQFRVRWDSAAEYAVSASAFLVADGRVVGEAPAWPFDRLASNGLVEGPSLPQVQPWTGVSRQAALSILEPTCLRYTDDGREAPPGGTATLHTLVQVQDEDGVPLATFVDALGIAGSTVVFDADREAMFTDVEPEERQAVLDARAELEPQRTVGAQLRDLVHDEGRRLSEVGTGLSRALSCVNEVRVAPDPEVLPRDFPIPPVPTEVSVRALGREDAVLTGGLFPDGDDWLAASQHHWLFVQDGRVRGHVIVYADWMPDGESDTLRVDWRVEPETCRDTTALEPGAYDLVGVMSLGAPARDINSLARGEWGALATWYDAGAVTVVE